MPKHWFIRFTVFYTDKKDRLVEIKGNATFTLNYESFRPGTVIRTLKNFYEDRLKDDKFHQHPCELYIDFCMEVDGDAVDDFQLNKTEVDGKYSIQSKGYCVQTQVEVVLK